MANLTKDQIFSISLQNPDRIVLNKLSIYNDQETECCSRQISVRMGENDDQLEKTMFFMCSKCDEGKSEAIVYADVRHRKYLLKQLIFFSIATIKKNQIIRLTFHLNDVTYV